MAQKLPVLVVDDLVLFPEMVIPLTISDEGTIRLIEEALGAKNRFAYFLAKGGASDYIHAYDLCEVGTEAEVTKMDRNPDGSIHIVVQGRARIRLRNIVQRRPYMRAEVEEWPDGEDSSGRTKALMRQVAARFAELARESAHIPEEAQRVVLNLKNPVRLSNLVSANLDISVGEKQRLLQARDARERLERLVPLVNRELEMARMGRQIEEEVEGEMDKFQRDHILREQMKAISRELGEGDEREADIRELRARLAEAGMPEEARRAAEQELGRLARIPTGSPEYSAARTHAEWLISLPWSKASGDEIDLRKARRVLAEDHHGLEGIKERILELLAVLRLKPDARGPILCFLGPPGVGKTSLGRSIARAMGRRFVRMPLGGVRDEAAIRGHRSTYVGSLPGGIIQAIRRAGVRNPVFMLDEVDKVGADFRGDPASALLEALDPEQNREFTDHYLEVPFDLSQVLFVTTANVPDSIPPALLDRMEVIPLAGYTFREKTEIVNRFLLPKQRAAHGLVDGKLQIEEAALGRIIGEYTREAGLRSLERTIAALCRKAALAVVEKRAPRMRVKARDLEKLLGPAPYAPENVRGRNGAGTTLGLAWTPTGGSVIHVESARMPGGKTLTLTGQLGEVMKESAQAALSYLRSRAGELGLEGEFFRDSDLHVHVPSGAIPKDGPSAGVTIAASLYSLLTGRRVKPGVAMTGEVTLGGEVLRVGGIKEKVLAALRAGLNTIILPGANRSELRGLPKEAKALKFVFAERVDDVLRAAFDGKQKSRRRPK